MSGYDTGYTFGGNPPPHTLEGRNPTFGNWSTATQYIPQYGINGMNSVHSDPLQLRDFFGPPLNQKAVNPYDAYPIEVEDLRQMYSGENPHMRKIFISVMQASDLDMLEICPYQLLNAMEASMDKITFEDATLRTLPEEAPADFVVHTKSTRRFGVVRKGKAFQIAYDVLKTPKGQMEYRMKVKQVSNAAAETACMDIMYQIANCEPEVDPYKAYRSDASNEGMNPLMDRLKREMRQWAFLQKHERNFGILIGEMMNEAIERGEGKPDAYILHKSMVGLSQTGKYYKYGTNSAGGLHADGLKEYQTRTYRLGHGEPNFDPMITTQTIGCFFHMTDENLSDVPANEYRTAMRTYMYYDENNDKIVPLKLDTALDYSGLYDLGDKNCVITSIGQKYMQTFQCENWQQVYKHSNRLKPFIKQIMLAPDSVKKEFIDMFGGQQVDLSREARKKILETRVDALARGGMPSSLRRPDGTIITRQDAINKRPRASRDDDEDDDCIPAQLRRKGASGAISRTPVVQSASSVAEKATAISKTMNSLLTSPQFCEDPDIIYDMLTFFTSRMSLQEANAFLNAVKQQNLVDYVDQMSAADRDANLTLDPLPARILRVAVRDRVSEPVVLNYNANFTCLFTDDEGVPFKVELKAKHPEVSSYLANETFAQVQLVPVQTTPPLDMWTSICNAVPETNAKLRASLMYNYLTSMQVVPAFDVPQDIRARMVDINKRALDSFSSDQLPMLRIPRMLHEKLTPYLLNHDQFITAEERKAYADHAQTESGSVEDFDKELKPTVSFEADLERERIMNAENASKAVAEAEKIVLDVAKTLKKNKVVCTVLEMFGGTLIAFAALMLGKGIEPVKVRLALQAVVSLYNSGGVSGLFMGATSIQYFMKLCYNGLADVSKWDVNATGDQVAARYFHYILAIHDKSEKKHKESLDKRKLGNVPDTSLTDVHRRIEKEIVDETVDEKTVLVDFIKNYISQSDDISLARVVNVLINSILRQEKAKQRTYTNAAELYDVADLIYWRFIGSTSLDACRRVAGVSAIPTDADKIRVFTQIAYEFLYVFQGSSLFNGVSSIQILNKLISANQDLKDEKLKVIREVSTLLSKTNVLSEWDNRPPAASDPVVQMQDTVSLTPSDVNRILKNVSVQSGQLAVWCMNNDLLIPFNFLFFRPHCRWRMAQFIMLQTGGKIGAMMYNRPTALQSLDINTQLITVQFYMYTKCVIWNPNMVIRRPNVFCVGYSGGMGSKIWHPFNHQDISDYNRSRLVKDAFIVAVPCTWQCTEPIIDITGTLHRNLRSTPDIDEAVNYPSAAIYTAHWNWENVKNPFNQDVEQEEAPRFNTLCAKDFYRTYEYATKQWSKNVVSEGHWGPYIYEGRAEVTQYGHPLFDRPQWTDINAISLS